MFTMSHLHLINRLSNPMQDETLLILLMVSFYSVFGFVMYLLIKSAYKNGAGK